ncbi:MAG: hypothetical protein ACUVXA_12850 [Candidatus Jordarchaeum sp.]|uniref:hypothetical protein n=1 Tax=Candidatus Jordarchaeum sp. TaxID=2823881 RepID=UPI00404A0F52
MYTTIKIRKETARRLAKLVGKLTSERERKISYDELINYLIDIAAEGEVSPRKKQRELSYATRKLLEMMEYPVTGAGPEDFREYDYSDVEG